MKTIRNYKEWKHEENNALPNGPWKSEPDKVQWIDDETDLDCLIVRNHSGALCGYVGLPEGHKFHGKEYDDIGEDLDVHGGLTFSNFCAHSEDESRFVCHVPEAGRPDKVWWIGFDCAHSGDVTPTYAGRFGHDAFSQYRDIGYVKWQVGKLAKQLKGITPLPLNKKEDEI